MERRVEAFSTEQSVPWLRMPRWSEGRKEGSRPSATDRHRISRRASTWLVSASPVRPGLTTNMKIS
jgi:hypothetical protein